MSNLNSYYHRDYSGGLNDTSSDKEIKRNEASLLRNWDITYQGQLRKRLGLLAVGIFPHQPNVNDTVTVTESKTVTIA